MPLPAQGALPTLTIEHEGSFTSQTSLLYFTIKADNAQGMDSTTIHYQVYQTDLDYDKEDENGDRVYNMYAKQRQSVRFHNDEGMLQVTRELNDVSILAPPGCSKLVVNLLDDTNIPKTYNVGGPWFAIAKQDSC